MLIFACFEFDSVIIVISVRFGSHLFIDNDLW